MSYFSSPIRLSVVGQAAGLSAPYRMSALVGKTVYNSSAAATVLPTTLRLSTFNGKSFSSPSWTSTQFNSGQNGNHYAWDARVPTENGTYSCLAVASGNSSKYMTWTCTVSGGVAYVSGFSLVNVDNGGSPRIGWSPSFALNAGVINGFPYSGGGLVYFIVDFWYRYADATYILTVTKTA